MLLAASGIVTVQADNGIGALLSLYEAFAACVLFLVTPPAVESALERLFFTTRQLPEVYSARQAVSLKMDHAARAMTEVAGTVDAVSEKLAGLSAPEPGTIYREASDDICRLYKVDERFFVTLIKRKIFGRIGG